VTGGTAPESPTRLARMRNLSIRTKLLVLVSVVGFVAISINSSLTQREVESDLAERMRLRAGLFARSAALAVESIAVGADLQRVTQALAAEPEVVELTVIDLTSGRILASERTERVGRNWDDLFDERSIDAIDDAVRQRRDRFLVDDASKRLKAIVPCSLRFSASGTHQGAVIATLVPDRIRPVVDRWAARSTRQQFGTIALLLVALSIGLDLFVAGPTKRLRDRSLRRWAGADSGGAKDGDELADLETMLASAELRIEQVLAELEQLDRAVESSAIVIRCDSAGHVRSTNLRMRELSGWNEGELVGKPPRLAEPADREAINAAIRRGSTWRGEVRLERATRDEEGNPVAIPLSPRGTDGLWLDITVVPLVANDGTNETIWIGFDVTDRRIAEANVARVRRATETIIDTAHDAVITCDERFVIVGWNRQAELTFGRTVDQALGEELAATTMADGSDALRYLGIDLDGDQSGLGQRHEVEGRRADGSIFAMEFTVNAIRAREGTLYAVFARDIDDRKRAELELVRTRDAAQAASRSKSEFLANMSHELRTPLTAILGYTEILGDLERVSSADRTEALATIHRNGQHLLGVINDILDLSKIEAGKLTIGPEPTDVRSLIGDVLESLDVRARAKGIRLEWSRDDLSPEIVLTDPIRLRQILMNLVGNAIKFTESGGVSLHLSTRVDLDEGVAMLDFAVSDTGIGMSDEQVARLFAPFEQVDNSAGRRFGGTGLGLAISHRLAEMLGGRIEVDSRPSQGSTFVLSIPAIETDRRPTVTSRPARETPFDAAPRVAPPPSIDVALEPSDRIGVGQAQRPLEGLHLLLVEDGTDNQRLIDFVLRKLGAQVTIAGDGLEALALFGIRSDEDESDRPAPDVDVPYDLVLTDIQMPRLDGYALASLLRASGCRIPIVALTAHAMSGERERCLEAGCDGYATKPIDRAELLSVIRGAMHHADL